MASWESRAGFVLADGSPGFLVLMGATADEVEEFKFEYEFREWGPGASVSDGQGF